MSQLRVWLITTLLLLVTTNAMWAMRLWREPAPELPRSYGCTQEETYKEIRDELFRPIVATVNASLKPGATKQSILAAAANPTSPGLLYCGDQTDVPIGNIGLRFSGDKLTLLSTGQCVE